jgi:hypothetical protein
MVTIFYDDEAGLQGNTETLICVWKQRWGRTGGLCELSFYIFLVPNAH